MEFIERGEIFKRMNQLGEKRVPFFFMVNFLATEGCVIPLTEISSQELMYSMPGRRNYEPVTKKDAYPLHFSKYPLTKDAYEKKFGIVKKALLDGDTYLLNLTCRTPVETNYSLEELFYNSKAKYKLWLKDRFVHFSPEPFVNIQDRYIYSCPMKGTADATNPNALNEILEDRKETAEQYIIVDLIRNDLSKVARKVKLESFRYTERIHANDKELIQVSSRIGGYIGEELQDRFGDIFSALLPAGSICGAPKQKTIEVILKAEDYDRGYYTGVWGIYDGVTIESCVMIRFIEQTKDGLVFKSGGGITALSECDNEYQEMIDKIYVPVY